MKNVYYLLCVLLLITTTSNTYAQKSIQENVWAFGVSGLYVNFQEDHWAFDEGKGISLSLEKILGKEMSFHADYTFMISNTYEYLKPLCLVHNSGLWKYNEYFHSLTLGTNWYIISSDIKNRFSPYIGANIIASYVHNRDMQISSEFIDRVLVSMNFAAAPSVGLNIPLSGSVVARSEFKYVFSIFDIVIEDDLKRDYDYYTLSLGVMFTF